MEHLRELRERKNLYQKDVAAALKIDRTTYAKYETGDSEPSFEILKRIALFYEVSVDYLLNFELPGQKTEEKQAMKLSPDEEEIITQYREFNERGKEKVREELYMMTISGIYKNSIDVPGVEL